jgi:hypothetical protein
LAGFDVVNGSKSIAACGNIASIKTESNATNNALMFERVYEVDIKYTAYSWVENSIPVNAFALQVWRHLFVFELCQAVANVAGNGSNSWMVLRLPRRGGWSWDMR